MNDPGGRQGRWEGAVGGGRAGKPRKGNIKETKERGISKEESTEKEVI